MQTHDFTLAALAEIGALRNLVVHAVALRLLDEPDPLQTLAFIDHQLTSNQTMPGDVGGALDPAMSDLLAALTDDRTQGLVNDVRARLASILGN
jgi:hypothetical protein